MAGDKEDTPSIRQKVLCLRCRHYFVTWDKNHPHGCKAFKLKSAVLPYYDIQLVSNMNCLKYEARPEKR
jgi:hypothetical protein